MHDVFEKVIKSYILINYGDIKFHISYQERKFFYISSKGCLTRMF